MSPGSVRAPGPQPGRADLHREPVQRRGLHAAGVANQMLDMLAEAWADANDGANIWADPNVTFLDPFTKSGVFLREITKRLARAWPTRSPTWRSASITS